MREYQQMPNALRARAVPDLHLEELLERKDELARHWAIALVTARPLEALGDVPLEDLARDAPALCGQLLRSLGSDAELDRLVGGPRESGRGDGGGVQRLAALSGARDASALVEAVEALRGVLWEALFGHLEVVGFERSPARRVADVSDRLAWVCSRTLAAALAAFEQQPARPGSAGEPAGIAGKAPEPLLRSVDVGAPGAIESHARPLIIDELAEAAAQPRARERARPREEIEIRDERHERQRAPWVAATARELERFRRDGWPFTLLLVELRNLARERSRVSQQRAQGLAEEIEKVLAAELRSGTRAQAPGYDADLRASVNAGSLTREGLGRFWLLAPDTDRVAAIELMRRLERALRRPVSHGGELLDVAFGIAVCPEDGTEASALVAHADLELFAARAAGVASASAGAPPQRRP
ncbi:MAG: hypothetical protein QOI03_846 [Solirubrobacteraceae bacterium]|nr:hypothetical protein [Solirubrobacteraceae bacterium]